MKHPYFTCIIGACSSIFGLLALLIWLVPMPTSLVAAIVYQTLFGLAVLAIILLWIVVYDHLDYARTEKARQRLC